MSTPDRRQAILDAALASFVARGYLATSISDIRAASGASTGSIYHFFAGKGALAEALLREMGETGKISAIPWLFRR